MNKKIKTVLNTILEAFETGDIPEAVAVASFPPIGDIPSAHWSFTNRTIQFISGTADARGYRQWLEVGRHVKKGARAIHILVPCFREIKKDEGEEEKETLTFFKASPVFKKEDTEGEELDYENIELPELPLIQRAYDWGVNIKAIPGTYRYYGYFVPKRNEIALATPAEKTFFHELAHAADYIIKGDLKCGQHALQEITAELSAQALARITGKNAEDTTGNSYQYIKHYSEQIKMSPHKACLKVLTDTEKILNLVLHGRADGGREIQKVA